MTKLKDIAAKANVSVSTVSRALNDHPAINLQTKRAIWALARSEGYVFKPSMPTLVSGTESTIVIVIPRPQARRGRISDPFFQELIGGIAEAARENACDILISHLVPTKADDILNFVTASRANGVIFLGQSGLHEVFNTLGVDGTSFLVWGAELPGQNYCSIGSDNERGGRRATEHLLRLGRKHIAFLGNIEAPEAWQRYLGYKQALDRAGVAWDEKLVMPAHFEIESAQAAVRQLIANNVKVDGIFAASDLIALGAIQALIKSGLSVPDDVSVVGYDDVMLSAYSQPALSTISQDINRAGRILVSKLLEAREGGKLLSERLPTDLIVRESCGA